MSSLHVNIVVKRDVVQGGIQPEEQAQGTKSQCKREKFPPGRAGAQARIHRTPIRVQKCSASWQSDVHRNNFSNPRQTSSRQEV
jgi:hypothetical protein